ncbi:MAG: hypothetical protein ACLFN2_07065 [Bacteroidales bacterium]
MVKLRDYIGSIVASIAEARVMSDVQTVEVAEQYARHELLKHFSVPRMRIEDVELTIPVALAAADPKETTAYSPIDNRTFNALAYRELVNSIGRESLPRDVSLKMQKYLSARTAELEKKIRVSATTEAVDKYCMDIVDRVMKLAKQHNLIEAKLQKKINPEAIQQKLGQTLTGEIQFREVKKSLEDLNVVAESHLLREEKPENIIYIKVKISEESMEWSRAENSEGGVDSKLLPE